ncbi:MAG: metallophosphoesterase family protein [Myxococcota bacterium]
MLRVAAAGDLHYTKSSTGALRRLFADVADRADVLLLAGDLTDYGHPEEAHALATDLRQLHVPVVAVLGNHDYESGKQDEVAAILRDAGITVLDGDSVEVKGVGIAGVKGFCGGFGRRALGAWGESGIKHFVQEAVDEAMRLEKALMRVRPEARIVLLHYSPVQGTVEGEPPEIWPFLGSSRLEEPLNRYAVRAVFHGHAHFGQPEAATSAGIPVYNVALPVLRRSVPGQAPFRVIELDV